MFMPCSVTQGMMVHFIISLLDSMAQERSADNKAVFVGDANSHHSEWLLFSPTHIADNRLDLVRMYALDTVDLFVDTPMGTSDHCFVSCVLQVE